MNFNDIQRYYSREDVQEALVAFAKNREIAGVYGNGSFSSRPNVLLHKSDVMAMVKQGIIEFHCSIEKWSEPMGIKTDNYDSLRSGWDLILDLDSKDFEHGKVAALVMMKALRKHNLEPSIKYTGGKGFHIGIPWESIPAKVDYDDSSKMFPQLARRIAAYLRDFAWDDLEKELLKKWTMEELAEKSGVDMERLVTEDGMNPYLVVDVDPVLISPRHLFRMPYSLNKKSFLVSLPISPYTLENFTKEKAKADGMVIDRRFMEASKPDQAGLLIAEAVDWWSLRSKEEEKKVFKELIITKPVPKDTFPPCIRNILNGLSEGRKRSMFIMLNFLRSSKWVWDDIEKLLIEWNQKNTPPLAESLILSQIRWHKNKENAVLPPNCYQEGWYTDFGVCTPDQTCKKIKNPVNYPFRKMKSPKSNK